MFAVLDANGNLKGLGAAHTHAESEITGLIADLAAKAPLASPALTGTPTAPTAAPGTSTTQLATTAFAAAGFALDEKLANKNAASGYAGLDASSKLTGSQQVYGTAANTAAQGNDARLSDARTPTAHAASHAAGGTDAVTLTEAQITNLVADLAAKAALASPALTGTPTAPTAGAGTNTTQIATTAFALTEAALKSGATATSTITTTGTQTALAIPAGTGDLIIRANNATLLTLQGIAAGIDGQRLTIESVGAGQVDLAHQHASATAANRLINFATVGLTSLAAGSGIAAFVYDATTARWRLLAHEQGAWITPAFNAGDFVGSSGMTWTVQAGDIVAYRYRLAGRFATLSAVFDLTSVAAPSNQGEIAVPAGLIPASYTVAAGVMFDNGVATLCQGSVFAGTGKLYVSRTDFASWQVSTNNTGVHVALSFEVQ